ncbi:MAG: cytochrome c [Planctomycetes bacterium]|nr:cytochrome c [Planctomycetota bacterium]
MADEEQARDTAREPTAGLHNVVEVFPGFINGSAPEGDAGFESLRALGVRTVISVDGAPPDVERARARGLRYVHLPIGYDGIGPEEALKLTRVVRDLPGPVYIHCHHGVHRSPAAAAAVMVGLGKATAEEATAFMRRAGTSPQYAGLYQCVGRMQRAEAAAVDAVPAEFPERARTSELVDAMAAVSRSFEYLEAAAEQDWSPPAGHPDRTPKHEAVLIVAALGDLMEQETLPARGSDFRDLLAQAERSARELQAALSAADADARHVRFTALRASCRDCHKRYRDQPLGNPVGR